jgi:hypothetical protein
VRKNGTLAQASVLRPAASLKLAVATQSAIQPAGAATEVGDAVWAVLKARFYPSDNRMATHAGDPAEAIRAAPTESSLPAALIAEAPHLEGLVAVAAAVDPYLKETFRLRRLFENEKNREEVVELLTRQNLTAPYPKAIWRDIVQDRMVSFERVNEAFGREFTLIGNQYVLAIEPLRTKTQWLFAYLAWAAAVLLVYPHRSSELNNFRDIILNKFLLVPGAPSLVILYDMSARERYARRPYRLDDRREHSTASLDIVSMANGSAKRSSTFESRSAKRLEVVCNNWNLGRCHETPCRNQRMHDVCSECGGEHRACDVSGCFELKGRR